MEPLERATGLSIRDALITKQKPEAAKKLKNRNVERARQMGIEYLKDKGINVDSKK